MGAKHDERSATSATTTPCSRWPPRIGVCLPGADTTVTGGSSTPTDNVRRDEIEPALRQRRLGRRRGRGRQRAEHADPHRLRGPLGRPAGHRWRCIARRWSLLLWLWMRRAAAQAARGRVRRRQAGGSRPTPTRWRRCRSRRSTICPRRSSSTSTTRCAPATTNWPWRSRSSAPTQTEPFSRAVDQRENDAGASVQRPPDPRRRRPRDAAAAPRPADPGDRRRGQGRPRTGRAARSVRASCAIW